MRAIFLTLALLTGIRAGAQVLATVGNSKITAQEFNKKLEEVRRQAMNPPTEEQFLEDLIRFEIGVQEAEREKLRDDPVVKERFRQVLYNSLLEKHIGDKVQNIKISDKEMRAFYKKNPELRIAHILIDMKPNASPEERDLTRKRALEILNQEVKGSKRPFAELVKLFSDDIPTKETGGDIGFQSRVTLNPVVYETALKMKEGEVHGLVETPSGFHILKLLDRRSFDLADKRQIRAALYDEKRADMFNDYFNRVKKKYKV
ncbi:MAG: peptidylprolyl isomerase, partial [Bdellovibrionales bacterium]